MPKGGKRLGAGRPFGHNKYGEATKVMRVPESRIAEIKAYLKGTVPNTTAHSANDEITIPLYSSKVAAGYPAPAEDYIEVHLNLNEHLIHRPNSTFLVRATGDSMINAGIFQDDLLIVDNSLPALNGKIVVAAIDGEVTVKRISRTENKLLFLPDNDDYTPIDATNSENVVIWGVVTNVIHAV